MSTTRSQKRRNELQESTEKVSEGLFSPVVVENSWFLDQDVSVAASSSAKFPKIEKSALGNLRDSLREEITSEIKTFLLESQKEMMKLLKPKTGENVREEDESDPENETRSFYTPTKSVRINSTQNNDPCTSRNRHFLEKNAANSNIFFSI